MKYTFETFDQRYKEMAQRVTCLCEAATEIAGGVDAKDPGIRAFVQHHLKLVGSEADAAFQRIKDEEIGMRDTTPDTGDLETKLTYGINSFRRTAIGPWLGSWMIHAGLKQAMSQLGMFSGGFIGTKGKVTECGKVQPVGISKLDARLDRVYLIDPNTGKPATTHYEEIKGKVQVGVQSKNIAHHTEVVPAGTQWAYEFYFLPLIVKEADIVDMLALSMICGSGSVRSLGHGHFRLLEVDIEPAAAPRKYRTKKENKDEAEKARKAMDEELVEA